MLRSKSKMKSVAFVLASFTLSGLATPALAENRSGARVDKILVGRLGKQIIVKLTGGITSGNAFACSPHPSGYNYSVTPEFPSDEVDIAELAVGASGMLSLLLTAKTTGQTVSVVSNQVCDPSHPSTETIAYIILD